MTGEQPGSGTTLNVVQITPPVEATLRILLNSVPFLMGAAVVRQPPGSDGVVAQVGRMPWLHDRRLTTLQLPDDALPANRAVALDWPVPVCADSPIRSPCAASWRDSPATRVDRSSSVGGTPTRSRPSYIRI